MNVQAFLVDILIIGSQCFAWFLMLIISIFGSERILHLINDNTLVVSMVLIISYIFGVIFDSLYEKICNSIFKFSGKEIIQNTNFVKLQNSESSVFKMLENQFQKIRIARGTFINLIPLTITTILVLIRLNDSFSNWELFCSSLVILLMATILLVLSFISNKSRSIEYNSNLESARSEFSNIKKGDY